MIKPIYGAASIGVVRVNTLEDLEKTYIRVQKEMSGARIVAGALTQGDDEDVDVRPYFKARKPMLSVNSYVYVKSAPFVSRACQPQKGRHGISSPT